MPDTKRYIVGEDTYEISKDQTNEFLLNYPKAIEIETFKIGEDEIDVPVDKKQKFFDTYPDAKPLKKKEFWEVSFGDSVSKSPGQESTSNFRTVASPEKKPETNYEEPIQKFTEQPQVNALTADENESIKKGIEDDKVLKEQFKEPKTVEQFIQENNISLDNYNPQKILNSDEQVDLYKKSQLKNYIKEQTEKSIGNWVQFHNKKDNTISRPYLYAPEESYLWSFLYGVTDAEIEALKSLDGASRLLRNIFGSSVDKTIFEGLAEKLEGAKEKGEKLYVTPDNLGGDLTRSAGQLGIDIPLIISTPSAKLKYAEALTGGMIKSIPGIASYMGATNFLQTYEEADKQDIPEVKKLTESAISGLHGVGTGYLLHSFGYLSSKTGNLVKGITENDIAGRVTSTITNGALFGGLTAGEQLIDGKIDTREIVGQTLLGIGLSATELLKKPVEEIVKEKQQLASDRFFTETPETIKKVNDIPYTVEELREKQVEVEDQIKTETDPKIKEELQIASKTLDGYIDIKAITKEVLSDPAKIIESIKEDPKLSDTEKKYYTDKVNQVTAENDPRIQAIKPKTEEIEKIDRNIEVIKENESMPDIAKNSAIEGLESRKEKLSKEINTEMSKPLDVLELNKVEQEKSKANESKKEVRRQKKVTEPSGAAEEIAAPENKKISEQAYKIAEKIRKGKIDSDIAMAGVPFAKDIWNGAVEVTAKTVEVTGDLAQAISDGVNHIKNSDWYKGLTEEDKIKAENRFKKQFEEEQKTTGIKHALTEETRKELGIGEYEKVTRANSELQRKADEEINKGYNVEKLLSEIEEGKLPTDVEQTILKTYISGLKEKVQNNPSDDLLSEIKRTIEATDIAGSEVARSLASRRGEVIQDDSLADFFIREMENANVDKLTDKQKQTVQKEYDEISKAAKDYQDKISELERQVAELKSKKAFDKLKAESQKNAKKTHDSYVSERDILRKSIAEKWKLASRPDILTAVPIPYAKQLAYIAPDVIKLAKSYVEEGVVNLKDLISSLHNDLKDDIPGISENDIHNIIAGEYKEKRQTKSEKQSILKDLKEEAKLINKLENLQKGIEPKEEKKKIERNQQITELRKQIKDFKSEKLKAEKEANKISPEERALKSLKTRTENQIKKLEEELSSGNFAKEEKKVPTLENQEIKKKFPDLYKEALDAKDKQIKLKQDREIRMLKEKYANRTKLQKAGDIVIDIIGIPRTLMASMDYSAPLRQGLVPTISHPIVASKAMTEMFKQSFSEKRFNRWLDDLQNSKDYHIIKESGLYIADIKDPKLSAKEEQFMNNVTEKIPIVGKLVKGSARAYTAYLNKMRVDLFRNMTSLYESEGKTLANSKNLYKETANYINNTTGRGGVGKFEEASKVLNSIFFSPRLIASRVNLLTNAVNPNFYSKVPKEVRVQYFKDMAKFISVGTSILALAKLNGAEVEDDPRSSDFGKIKIGNLRYDIWGGFQQYVRLASQLLTGETKSVKTGNIKELGKNYGDRTRLSVLMDFVRSKLAPVPATATNLLSGKTLGGDPVNLKDEALKSIIPLWIQDASDAMQDENISALFYVGVPNMIGIGTQVYSNKEENNRIINKFEKSKDPNKIFKFNPEYILINEKFKDLKSDLRKTFKEKGSEETKKYIQGNNIANDLVFYNENKSGDWNNINRLLSIIDELSKQAPEVQKKYKSQLDETIKSFIQAYKNKDQFEISDDLLEFSKEVSDEENEKEKEFNEILNEF